MASLFDTENSHHGENMETTNKPWGGQLLTVTLVGSIVSAINGAVFALITATHGWGIVSLLVLLAIAYWIVQYSKFFMRAARIHRYATGVMIALAMMGSYMLAETLVTASFMGTDLGGFYVSRWNTGITLFGGGSWAIDGWVWSACYVLKILLLLVLFTGAAADEGDRPFCESCGSATTRLIWKQVVGRFDEGRLTEFARKVGQWNIDELLTTVEQDTDGDHGILIHIWTCACGSEFEFKAESYNLSTNVAARELVGFLPMDSSEVSRIVRWVWTIDPKADIPETVHDIYKERLEGNESHKPGTM